MTLNDPERLNDRRRESSPTYIDGRDRNDRDGTSRDRLCLLFVCSVVLSVLVLNIVHFSSTYAVTAGFAVLENDLWTRSIL